MPQSKRPEPGHPILVEIGEQIFELKFPLRVLKTLDVEHGISVIKGTGMADIFSDPEKLGLMLYHGLRSKQPEITLDWVQDNVDASMLLTLAPITMYAITGRWMNVEPKVEGEDPNRAALKPEDSTEDSATGSRFGQSVAMISDSQNPNSGS